MRINTVSATHHRKQVVGFVGLSLFFSVTAALIWYRFRRRAMPIDMTEVEVATAEVMPHAISENALYGDAPLQLLTSGAGPLFVRSYQVDIMAPKVDAEHLMRNIIEDINPYVPQALARFEKVKGDPHQMAVGDEYLIHIAGPWNGPVRVIRVTPTAFALVTLEGHPEAGEISFSVLEHPERHDALRFRIQSWARSSNMMTDVTYRILGISQLAQTTVWTHFCEQVVKTSGGEIIDKIQVMTHKTSVKHVLKQIPHWKLYASQFERWGKADLNFDINKTEDYTEANGWKIDDYAIGLPGEDPGAPAPHGAFQAAKEVIANYEFPDPTLITGIFVPDGPLEDRIMVLRARFLIFTFLFGVRIRKVIDEVRATEKQGNAHVWGYSYYTLEGHFEMGEITFEVWKYEQTGEVRFHVHAYSKPYHIDNLFYRIGFAIFGRSLQVRFARTATVRMQQLVLERLAKPQTPAAPTVDTPEVLPISASPVAEAKAEEVEAKVEDQATSPSST
ncbi:MAG: DUF1990 family protein [Armatimonadetes bacterium]|nr:DUF1990 family protein [Anaerolineae bacterium]